MNNSATVNRILIYINWLRPDPNWVKGFIYVYFVHKYLFDYRTAKIWSTLIIVDKYAISLVETGVDVLSVEIDGDELEEIVISLLTYWIQPIWSFYDKIVDGGS